VRAWLALAEALALARGAALVLDEPTNHLTWTRAVLTEAHADWRRPLLFVSHDRLFIGR
jgi:ATPase subunit of ABC transporter with duplicated ATPase domains